MTLAILSILEYLSQCRCQQKHENLTKFWWMHSQLLWLSDWLALAVSGFVELLLLLLLF